MPKAFDPLLIMYTSTDFSSISECSEITLSPNRKAQGMVTPPGSKSVANRVLPVAAFGNGMIQIQNIPNGEDVQLMLSALRSLDISIVEKKIGDTFSVAMQGAGGPITLSKDVSVHLGNSGTCARFLTGMLSACYGTFALDGIPRMRERPIKHLLDALEKLENSQGEALQIECQGESGFFPLTIHGQGLYGGNTEISGETSSQFLTGLLLAMPLSQKAICVERQGELVSHPYIKITLDVMEQFGISFESAANEQSCYTSFAIQNPTGYTNPSTYYIEADASSASYFLAAGAIGGGPVTVKGVGTQTLQWSSEGRFAEMLAKMGAHVTIEDNAITVAGGDLHGIEANMDTMSDTGMTLAMVALFAKGSTKITHIGNWRVKETDRIHAMAQELQKLGATIEEGEDYLHITPPTEWKAASIATYNDHRMAMCFSLAAFGPQPVTILDPKCIQKTYPDYFQDFQKLTEPS
jgi:3-phosphoshikimate 1-carboxyvinyltransferase